MRYSPLRRKNIKCKNLSAHKSTQNNSQIPKFYEDESTPLERKIIHQKWTESKTNFVWLIAELDPKKNLAFGYANLNDDDLAEWGNISIDEIKSIGAAIDEKWTPVPFADALKKINTIEITKSTEKTDDGYYVYSFEKIPQQHRMMVICNGLKKSDKKALEAARDLNPKYEYVIV